MAPATPIQPKSIQPKPQPQPAVQPSPAPAATPTQSPAVATAGKQKVVGIQSLGSNTVNIKDGQLIVQGPDHAAATAIARQLASGQAKVGNVCGKRVLVILGQEESAPADNSPLESLTRGGGLLAAQVPGGPEGDPQSVSNISLASSIKTTANELKRKYDSIETKIQEVNSNVEKRMARLESKLENSSESIKSKIEAQSTKNNNGNVVKPKCPICFEELSTKIAQCISGHLLCWPCKEKMGDKNCAFCDQPVNGRAFGMEAYLRTIFG